MFGIFGNKVIHSMKDNKLINSVFRQEIDNENEKTNYKAGLEILDHFENEWLNIHNLNYENILTADKIAENVDHIREKCEKEQHNLILLNNLMSDSNTFPSIVSLLNKCNDQLKAVQSTIISVESELCNFEISLEEKHLIDKQFIEEQKLKFYEKQKKDEINRHQEQLEIKKMELIKAIEEKQKKSLKDKQRKFEEEFKRDLQMFKEKGLVSKKEKETDLREEKTKLEDIELDMNNEDLDNFLNN